jgi:hypothetical protein
MATIRQSCRNLTILITVGWLFSLSLPAFAGSEGLNLVTEVRGDASVQRDGRKAQRARVGDRLKASDKLSLGKGGAAKVLCDNASIWKSNTVGTFAVAKGCQAKGRTVLRSANQDRIPTRSGNDPTIPFVISPRNTNVIDSQQLLRWNPVAGARAYRVSVTGPDVKWKKSVNRSQALFSDVALKPGMRYRVMVTAENGASSQSETGIGFSILDSATATQIKSDISALQRQELSEEAQVLAIAHLERSNELYGSAIDRLEVWLARGNKSAAVSQLAGDLNRQVGLPGLARDHYVVGLEMMRQDGNLAAQAEVLNSLGQVDRDSDRLKAAIGWLEEAQKRYRQLGDGERVQQLGKELIDLRKRV